MDKQPSGLMSRWVWWAAGIVVILVAVVVCVGLYAMRRTEAYRQLTAEGTSYVQSRPPSSVPEALEEWVPPWAYVVQEIRSHNRREWKALAAFSEVERVAFWDAGLTDADLRAVRGMRRLTALEFGAEPGITDAGLVHVEGLPHLAKLFLREVQVSDAGLQSIARIPNLESLCIQRSRVTGAGLAALAEARRLHRLELEIGAGPVDSLGALEQLESLHELALYGPGVTVERVRQLRLPPRLRALSLWGNDPNDAQEADVPALLAAVPGIEHVETLDLGRRAIDSVTAERMFERLGMVKESESYRRRSP